jgi:GDP-L-fucose synthase
MNTYNEKSHINIGTGKDISIKELAEIIKEVVSYEGEIIFDKDKPDGTFRKVLDVSKAKELGWEAKIGLKEGIKMTYELIKDTYL